VITYALDGLEDVAGLGTYNSTLDDNTLGTKEVLELDATDVFSEGNAFRDRDGIVVRLTLGTVDGVLCLVFPMEHSMDKYWDHHRLPHRHRVKIFFIQRSSPHKEIINCTYTC